MIGNNLSVVHNKQRRFFTYHEYINERQYLHSSIQLLVPQELSNHLVSYLDNEINLNDKIDSRYVLPHHISVMTDILEDDVSMVEYIADQFGPIHVSIGKIGMFKAATTRYHLEQHEVLKLDVYSKELENIYKKLSNSIPTTEHRFSFLPHITLVYLKPGTAQNYVDDLRFSGTHITFDRIAYSHPNGQKTFITLR